MKRLLAILLLPAIWLGRYVVASAEQWVEAQYRDGYTTTAEYRYQVEQCERERTDLAKLELRFDELWHGTAAPHLEAHRHGID